MASKAYLLLALVFAVVLLVSSQIADAKDLDDASQVEDAKYGLGGYNNGGGHDRYNNGVDRGTRCRKGCCSSKRYGVCRRCCGTFAEATAYKQAHEAQTRN